MPAGETVLWSQRVYCQCYHLQSHLNMHNLRRKFVSPNSHWRWAAKSVCFYLLAKSYHPQWPLENMRRANIPVLTANSKAWIAFIPDHPRLPCHLFGLRRLGSVWKTYGKAASSQQIMIWWVKRLVWFLNILQHNQPNPPSGFFRETRIKVQEESFLTFKGCKCVWGCDQIRILNNNNNKEACAGIWTDSATAPEGFNAKYLCVSWAGGLCPLSS